MISDEYNELVKLSENLDGCTELEILVNGHASRITSEEIICSIISAIDERLEELDDYISDNFEED